MFRVATSIPCDALLPYINSYQLVETTFSSGYQDKSVAPHVISALAFNIGLNQTIYHLQNHQFLNTSIILEPNKHYNMLRFFPGTRMFIMNFKSDGYYRIFRSASLHPLECIHPQLKRYDRFPEQIKLVESYLIKELKHHKKYCRNISTAIELIYSSNGNATIHELEMETFITKRTLERHFLKQTGMNLKIFSRIVRFNKMMKYITDKKTISWAELAHKFGYYDLKHLRREFHYFTGSSLKNCLPSRTGPGQVLGFEILSLFSPIYGSF